MSAALRSTGSRWVRCDKMLECVINWLTWWMSLHVAGYIILVTASSHSQKSQWRPAQDMKEQRATNPTEEKTCLTNDLADNELRFRDMDLPNVSAERDQRLWTMVLSKNAAHLRTEHVTNEEVFHRANTKLTLLDGLIMRRLAFHGHLVRKRGVTLVLMIGRLHGTRPRGRSVTTWLKDLATQANISYKEAITIPRDRKKWRSVGNPRRTPHEWVSEWVRE